MERHEQTATVDGRSIFLTRPKRQNDRGRQRVRADRQHPAAAFASQWPRRRDRPPGLDHPVEERFPTGRRGPILTPFRLLERVVDGDREIEKRPLPRERKYALEPGLKEPACS